MPKIYPTVLVKSKQAYINRLNRYKGFFDVVQIDVENGSYVKGKSYYCSQTTGELKLPFKLDMHLMIDNPRRFIKRWKTIKNVFRFFVHIETIDQKEWQNIKLELKDSNIELAMAISPKSNILKIKPYLADLKTVLVMGVIPGRNAAPFIPSTYKRIKDIKKLNPKIKVAIDGGVTDKTSKKLATAGADILYSGSYLTKSDDLKQAIKNLI